MSSAFGYQGGQYPQDAERETRELPQRYQPLLEVEIRSLYRVELRGQLAQLDDHPQSGFESGWVQAVSPYRPRFHFRLRSNRNHSAESQFCGRTARTSTEVPY